MLLKCYIVSMLCYIEKVSNSVMLYTACGHRIAHKMSPPSHILNGSYLEIRKHTRMT
jgi:hypothetical protein